MIELDDGTTFPPTAKGHIELQTYIIEQFTRGREHPPPVLRAIEPWLLPLGEEFTGRPLPSDYVVMEPQMCFSNAFALVTFNPELTYCEGFVIRDGLPLLVHHGWCVDDGGVIEPTLNEPSDSDSYFGVAFPDFEAVESVVNETGTYSVLYKPEGTRLVERIASERSRP